MGEERDTDPETHVARAFPVSVAGLDALIQRGYARMGWRLPIVCAAGHWVFVLIFHITLVAQIGRIKGIGRHRELVWLGRITVGLGAAIVVGLVASVLVARPLARLLQVPGEDAAREALRLAHRLPTQLIGVNFLAGVVLSFPVTVVSTSAAVPVTPSLALVLAMGGLGAIVLLCISSWAWYRLVMMPMLRDISARIPERTVSRPGPAVSVVLITAVPGLVYGCGVGALIIGAPSHTSWTTVIERLAVAIGLALLFILPIALLLAHASVHPLGELLAATRRLQAGDYDLHVPVLPGREFEALAETLNSAMDGLAERQRLSQDNESLLDEVQASRARIVAAGDVERRRVERNIHDGAQQRLVALALELRMLEDVAAAASSPQVEAMARDAGASLKDALDELRELARGLHPAVLATDGIRPALEQVVARSPLPVHITVPDMRFAPVVESTAYFVACEALANVAKHASASCAAVVVQLDGDLLTLRVSDDGVGGAEIGRGSGLTGLADRLAALSGTLTVTSSPTGTVLVAELPVTSSSVDEASSVEGG